MPKSAKKSQNTFLLISTVRKLLIEVDVAKKCYQICQKIAKKGYQIVQKVAKLQKIAKVANICQKWQKFDKVQKNR